MFSHQVDALVLEILDSLPAFESVLHVASSKIVLSTKNIGGGAGATTPRGKRSRAAETVGNN